MEGKEQVTVTIDKDIYDIKKARKDLNFSGLVNRLLRNYFMGEGGRKDAALKSKLESLKEKKERLENKLKETEVSIKNIEKSIEDKETKEDELKDVLNRFAEKKEEGELTELNYRYLKKETGLSKDEINEKLDAVIDEGKKNGQAAIASDPEEAAVKTVARQLERGREMSVDDSRLLRLAERADIEPEELLKRARGVAS